MSETPDQTSSETAADQVEATKPTTTEVTLGRMELSPQRIELSVERATFTAMHIVPPHLLAKVLRGEHVDPTSPKTEEGEVQRG
jgi:hypothetical protein